MKIKTTTLVVAILILAGAIIRLHNLGWNSLWLDEAATLFYAESGFAGAWHHFVSGEYNPPLFYWVTTAMLTVGRSEFVLRLFPCLIGIATIPLMYIVGKEWRNERIGLISSALVAFIPFHVFYSQEARAYTFAVFLVLAMFYTYMRATRENKRMWWILTGIIAALCIWTHFYTAFAIIAIYVHSLVTSFKITERLKNIVISALAFVWVSLPVILVVLFYLIPRRFSGPPTYGIRGLPLVQDIFWNFGSNVWYVAIVLIALVCIGALILYRNDKEKAIFVSSFILITLVITVVLSYKMPMVSRYVIYLYPFLALLAAEPFAAIKNNYMCMLFVAGFIALNTPTLVTYHSVYTKDDWRGYGQWLGETIPEGSIIVTVPGYMKLPLEYYYNISSHNVTLREVSNVGDILNVTIPGKTYYVMTPDIAAVDTSFETPRWLEQNTEFLGQWEYNIYTFKK